MDEKLLLQIYANGYWFQLPRRLLLIVDRGDAIVLAYLLNRAAFVGKKYKGKDGWFWHTAKQMERALYMNYDAQHHAIKKLAKGGWLQTELRDMPPRRYFKLNVKIIHEAIAAKLKQRKAARLALLNNSIVIGKHAR